VLELGDFANSERTKFSSGNVEGKGAELDTFDFFDEEADGLEHAADLAIAAFDESDFVPGIGGVFVELDFRRRSFDTAAVVEGNGDTVAKALDRLLVGAATDFDEIGFGDVRAGFGQFLCEVAIVGEKQESFAGVVETPNGIDAGIERTEELHDSGAAFGIGNGGDVAFGLVEKEIERALGGFDGLAVDTDVVLIGVGFGAEFGDDLAIYGDAAGGDDLFSFAT